MSPGAETQQPPTRTRAFPCRPPSSHIIFPLDHSDKLGNCSMTPIIEVSSGTSCPFESSASFLSPAVDLPCLLPSGELCCHQTYAKCVICVISEAHNQMAAHVWSLVLIADCVCGDAAGAETCPQSSALGWPCSLFCGSLSPTTLFNLLILSSVVKWCSVHVCCHFNGFLFL